jgi:hypothetical protein
LKKASLLNEALLQEFISFLKSLELDADFYLKELQKYCNQNSSHTAASAAVHHAYGDEKPTEHKAIVHDDPKQVETNYYLNENHEYD